MATLQATYVIVLDENLCCASRACLPACKYGGLIHVPGESSPLTDPWSCSGCGSCIAACPNRALSLIPRGIS